MSPCIVVVVENDLSSRSRDADLERNRVKEEFWNSRARSRMRQPMESKRKLKTSRMESDASEAF